MKNLKSLASMVESCDDEYLKFDLEYDQVNMILAIFVLYWLKLQDFIFSKHTLHTEEFGRKSHKFL